MTFSQIRRTMFQHNCGHGYLCIYLWKLFLHRSPDLFRRLLLQTKTIQMQYPISVSAVSSGSYYETPYGPYGWLSSPPAVQRYQGILWLGELLYPDYTEYDLQTEVTEYYELFYGCELTEEMYQDLVANALPQ